MTLTDQFLRSPEVAIMTPKREWVPYDAIVTSERSPGDEFLKLPAVTFRGPDADGLFWIMAEAAGLAGAVSVRADSGVGRAFIAATEGC